MHYSNYQYIGELAMLVHRFIRDCEMYHEVGTNEATFTIEKNNNDVTIINLSFEIHEIATCFFSDRKMPKKIDFEFEAEVCIPIDKPAEFFINNIKVVFEDRKTSADVQESYEFERFIGIIEKQLQSVFDEILEAA